MKNDRGFSLIELIVVMLIMAILAVGSMTGFNMLNAGNAKNTAEQVISALNYVQTANMTKSNKYTTEIKLNDTNGKYILSIIKEDAFGVKQTEDSEEIELKNGQISFQNIGDITWHEVTSTETLIVGFRKDTGGVKANVSGNTVSRIKLTSKGATCYIRLVTTTGKHFIE